METHGRRHGRTWVETWKHMEGYGCRLCGVGARLGVGARKHMDRDMDGHGSRHGNTWKGVAVGFAALALGVVLGHGNTWIETWTDMVRDMEAHGRVCP